MDVYLTLFVLGVVGLAAMAAGVAGRGHGGHGHTPAGHGAGGRGYGGARGHGSARGGGGHEGRPYDGPLHAGGVVMALASPRVIFAVVLGAGAAGLLLRPFLTGLLLAGAAALLGVLFERLAVAPVWRFAERFASAPAQTLETALYDHARAASGFDARGEGIVALEVDGQVVQLLGRLRPEDRRLRVRAGDRLRVEDLDAERHRCTVSVAGAPGGLGDEAA